MEFPNAPDTKTGWPWGASNSSDAPGTEPGTYSHPRITVVTPSFNQGRFLEETIRSVLLQGYRNLEYIIVDGGSTDGSVDIIRKYEDRLAYWVSEPDNGQTDAIDKGWRRATGSILAWLNSDDVLLPGALERHAAAYSRRPEADVFYGNHVVLDAQGRVVERYMHPPYVNKLAWLTMPYIAQPGTVLTHRIWDQVGGMDTTMHCAFDYDLWYRFMEAGAEFVHVGGFVSGFRQHAESKGATWLKEYAREHALLRERYASRWGTPFARRLARLALMGMQALSGAYLHTLAFRLFCHHRLARYTPTDRTAHA